MSRADQLEAKQLIVHPTMGWHVEVVKVETPKRGPTKGRSRVFYKGTVGHGSFTVPPDFTVEEVRTK